MTDAFCGRDVVRLAVSPRTIMASVRQMAQARDLWIGFRPTDTPVAIYDERQTWLFCHPTPPDGFQPQPDGISVYEGLHPTVRADTACLVGDVWTAIVMTFAQPRSLEEAASTVIHEMFHVFQITHHKNWWGDEADRFLYPIFDEEALCLRRLEARMLRRALAATDATESMRYARAAVGLRKQRYALVGARPAAYERGMERVEGLAHHVQDLSLGRTDPSIPAEEFSADDVRRRCYAVGAAWARLLDRHAGGWVAEFDRGEDAPALDATLEARLGASIVPAAVEPDVAAAERTRAAEDIRSLRCRYREMKDGFMSLPGWRVVFESGENASLRTRATDPSNMTMLNQGEVLHTRYLVLKSASSSDEIEILGASALTESGGAHPLYDGIRRVTVAGLSDEPTIVRESGSLQLTGPGITARVGRATVQAADHCVRLMVES